MDDRLFIIEDLCFSYGAWPVLSHFNAEFRSGMVYGILGANGSGKTTFLDLLCGILKPDSGRVIFQNRPVSSWNRRSFARHVALVPQDFSVRFAFSVRQVVEMGRHPHVDRFATLSEYDIKVVDEAMRDLGVDSLAGRPVTRLSGGEKQRVVTARALAQEPDVMVLDEATSNLDIRHTITILDVLRRRVRDNGLTVIAVMHDVNMAAMFCDELFFVAEGSVICHGAVDAVMTAEIMERTYGIEAGIRHDSFAMAPQASFRLGG